MLVRNPPVNEFGFVGGARCEYLNVHVHPPIEDPAHTLRHTRHPRFPAEARKMSLEGKVAVVTGAAAGIGKAFSEILFKNGAKVNLKKANCGV